ncbi:hypothetical protein RND81_09G117800 [Saponaria officinalis]|uniref:Uncharacterized protein n=1 Tax=Saponaria officinalis TaxID=3572 RepID=A0AAW1IKS3_SAPOF
MDACKAKMKKSLAITPLKFNEAASRASSSTADPSLPISHGDVQGKLIGRKSEASTLHKRKRQNPTPCPKQVEGGSSSFDEARAVNTKPQRFITFELPDDLPTDEEIRQQAPDECIALCLLMKRDAELISRLNLQRMNAVKTELQKNGHREIQQPLRQLIV